MRKILMLFILLTPFLVNGEVEYAISHDQYYVIPENAGNGWYVGEFHANVSDTMIHDRSGSYSFSIVSGDPSNAFSINSSTGLITINDSTVFYGNGDADYTLGIQVAIDSETETNNAYIHVVDEDNCHFIDMDSGSGGNTGTRYSPYYEFDDIDTLLAGHAAFLKRGTTGSEDEAIVVKNGVFSESSPFYLAAYGTGTKPLIDNNTQYYQGMGVMVGHATYNPTVYYPCPYVNIYDISVKDFSGNASYDNGNCFKVNDYTDYVNINRCEGEKGGMNGEFYIRPYCEYCKIIDCKAYDNPDSHNFKIESSYVIVTSCTAIAANGGNNFSFPQGDSTCNCVLEYSYANYGDRNIMVRKHNTEIAYNYCTGGYIMMSVYADNGDANINIGYIHHNVFYDDNYSRGMSLTEASYLEVYYNVVTKCGTGIALDDELGSNNKVYNNVFYDNTLDVQIERDGIEFRNNIYQTAVFDGDSVPAFNYDFDNGDPFVEEENGDFHLDSIYATNLIDQGYSYGAMVDLDNVSVPQYNGTDIGAYEHPGSGGSPSISVSVTAYDSEATEASETTGTFRVSRGAETSGDLTVNFSMSGSATLNTDYTLSETSSVTINNGYTYKDIILTPDDDGNYEGNETATLTVTSGSGYSVGSPSSANITIIDDDSPGGGDTIAKINFTTSEFNETGWTSVTGEASFPLYLDDGVQVEDTILPYHSIGNGTSGEPVNSYPDSVGHTFNYMHSAFDYTLIYTFSGLSTSDTYSFYVFTSRDDNVASGRIMYFSIEGEDDTVSVDAVGNTNTTLALEGYSPDGSGEITFHVDKTSGQYGYINALVVVKDGASDPEVTILSTDDTATEASETTGTFRVSRGAETSGNLTVNFSMSGSATLNTDYTLSETSSVTITDGNAFADITLTADDDASVEGDEIVIMTISSGTGYTIGSPSSDTITIVDDDYSEITISATDDTATEASETTGTFRVSRGSDTSGNLTVNFSTGGTATLNTDYTLSATSSVTITDGNAFADITLTPDDDASIEDDEIAIMTISSGTGYTIGSPSSDTITIVDDDFPEITISATDDEATEAGETTGTFRVSRGAETSGNLTVNFSTSGSATLNTDYTLSETSSVTITNGNAYADITLTVDDDVSEEGDEIAIMTISSGTGYTVGSPSSDTITIVDDDGSGYSDPIAHWKFEQNWDDEMDNYDLTNTPDQYWVTGPTGFDYGTSFNSSTRYAYTSTINLGNQFTITGWYKSNLTGGYPTLLSNSNDGEYGFKLYMNISGDERLSFYTENSSNQSATAISTTMLYSQATWAHVAAVVDRSNGTCTLYVNGSDVTSSSTIRNDFKNNASIWFGRTYNEMNKLWGHMDDVRIYDYLVDADDIEDIYAGTKGARIDAEGQVSSVSVFPIPFSDVFTVKGASQLKRIEVLNINGKSLLVKDNSGNPVLKVNMSNYPAGYYIMRSTDYSGQITVKKLIKR